MSDPSLEGFNIAKAEYERAGRDTGARLYGLSKARDNEHKAGQNLLKVSKVTFRDGLIITRVAHPDRLKFTAGYTLADQGFDNYLEKLMVEVDEIHAQKMVGRFASSANVELDLSPREIPKPGEDIPDQPQPTIGFILEGVYEPSGPHGPNSPNNPNTYYYGDFRAIEWRLPTMQEIITYGRNNSAV